MDEMKEIELKFIDVEKMQDGIQQGFFELSKRYSSGSMSIQFDMIIKNGKELTFHLGKTKNDLKFQYMKISISDFINEGFLLLKCEETKNG